MEEHGIDQAGEQDPHNRDQAKIDRRLPAKQKRRAPQPASHEIQQEKEQGELEQDSGGIIDCRSIQDRIQLFLDHHKALVDDKVQTLGSQPA